MKGLKKTAALLLVLVLMLSLTACGSFESKLIKGSEKMQELESYHSDMALDMAYSMSILGESMDMDMLMKIGVDIQTEPEMLHMVLEMSSMGQSETAYAQIEGDRAFASLDNVNWQEGDMEELGFTEIDSEASLDFIAGYAANFEEVGEESVNGVTAVRYDGLITDDDVDELMNLMGSKEMIAENFGVPEEEIVLEGEFSIPTSVWLDKKTNMILRYDMDMQPMMAAIFDSLMMEMMGEELGDPALLEEMQFEFAVTRTLFSASFSQFDSVPAIESVA